MWCRLFSFVNTSILPSYDIIAMMDLRFVTLDSIHCTVCKAITNRTVGAIRAAASRMKSDFIRIWGTLGELPPPCYVSKI